MVPAIETHELTKTYGSRDAIRGVSCSIEQGEIVGFLGPNGAGKSTTLRILTGFLGATSGHASILGFDVATQSQQTRAKIGYMPETAPLYPEMRVREYLKFRAQLKHVPYSKQMRAIEEAMELAHIKDVANTLIEHLSKGYRQRVALADALVSKPPVLILDEPTAGMDPNQIRDVRTLIRELRGQHTILLSTHILPEVETTCSRVLVIHQGKLVAEGSPSELATLRKPPCVEFIIRDPKHLFLSCVEQIPAIILESTQTLEKNIERKVLRFTSSNDDMGVALEQLIASLVSVGVGVRQVSYTQATLEDVFTSLTTQPEPIESEA